MWKKNNQPGSTLAAAVGRLEVRPLGGDDVDGERVLRYHSVPGLRSSPEVPLREVMQADDPVPFIGLPRTAGPVTIEWGGPR